MITLSQSPNIKLVLSKALFFIFAVVTTTLDSFSSPVEVFINQDEIASYGISVEKEKIYSAILGEEVFNCALVIDQNKAGLSIKSIVLTIRTDQFFSSSSLYFTVYDSGMVILRDLCFSCNLPDQLELSILSFSESGDIDPQFYTINLSELLGRHDR